jgi:hypothetical protein
MQIALAKRQPKRRCRIPRRPHPNLDYFFGRLEHGDGAPDDDAGLDNSDLAHPFRNEPMKPHCPNCLKEMTKASASRNLFNCEPCREIIQYFGGSADHGEPGPQFSWPIRRKRSVHTAHAA